MKLFSFFCCLLFISCPSGIKERGAAPATKVTHPSQNIKDAEQLWQKANELVESRQYAEARTYLRRYVSAFAKEEHFVEAQQLFDEVEKRLGVGRIRVGVLLPLSGHYARFGESVLDGVACAAGVFDPYVPTLDNVQLVLADATDDPAGVQTAVATLADPEKAALIVGPLLSKIAEAAASLAEVKEIPMIVLAPADGVGRGKRWVFQHSVTPTLEVKMVVAETQQRGLKHFLVLHPQNQYGEKYRTLFEERLAGMEGVRVESMGYPPETLDFVNVLRQWKLKEGRMRFDAIFIPDSYRQARLIAPALSFVGMKTKILLGTVRWHHPHLVAQRVEEGEEKAPASPLEGAVFAAGFNPRSLENFKTAFGTEPGWLETFGFEAAQMGMHAIKNRQNDYRPDVLASLNKLYEWDEDHLLKNSIALLTVRAGTIQPLVTSDEGVRAN